MITADDLTVIRAMQESVMHDTCVQLAYSAGTVNAAGEVTAVYTAAGTCACGLHLLSAHELERADMNPVLYDAVLRLPVTVAIDPRDRIRITHRYGETLAAPWVYEVAGGPRLGPSAIQVDVKRVDL